MNFIFPINNVLYYRVAGRDAERYLHGRLTQDIKGLGLGQVRRSLVLTPQGRVQGNLIVARVDAGFILIVDNSEGYSEVFERSLLQFKVADQVELAMVTDIEGLIVPARGFLPKITDTLINSDFQFSLVSSEKFLLIVVHCGHVFNLEIGDYESLRIDHGIPRFGVDIDEKTIASDLPLLHFASFNKGCYAGQEVVEMATARGRPNREFKIFTVPAETSPRSEIFQESETKPCGIITSVSRQTALGFIKNGTVTEKLFVNGKPIYTASAL